MIPKLDTAVTLAIVVTLAFILVIFGWMFFPPRASDAGSLAVLNTLTGVLGTAFVSIVSFYFGSSTGSKGKDETISQMATSAAAASTPAPAPTPAAAPVPQPAG